MGLNPKGKARVMVIWRADGLGWIVRWPLGKLTKKQAWLGPKQTGQTRFSYPVEKRVRPVCTWLGPKQTGQTLVKVFPFLEKECSVQAWIYADQAWGDSRYFKIGRYVKNWLLGDLGKNSLLSRHGFVLGGSRYVQIWLRGE